MKKIILKLTLVAAFVVSAGYSLYTSQVNEDLSDLALANIEALAGGEGDIKHGDPCWNADYNADKPKAVKCGSPCRYEPLDIHWWSDESYCL